MNVAELDIQRWVSDQESTHFIQRSMWKSFVLKLATFSLDIHAIFTEETSRRLRLFEEEELLALGKAGDRRQITRFAIVHICTL